MPTLAIKRGADFSAQVAFKNSDGTVIDLTGYAVTAAITLGGAGSLAVPIIVANAALGLARMALDDVQTQSIPFGAISTLRIDYVSAGGLGTHETCVVEGL